MKLTPNGAKAEALCALLRNFTEVMIFVLAEHPGVALPAGVKAQGVVSLSLGLNMAVPIPDLAIDENGISCTLSFSRVPFYSVIPWEAVAMVQVPTDLQANTNAPAKKGRGVRKHLSQVRPDAVFDPALQEVNWNGQPFVPRLVVSS